MDNYDYRMENRGQRIDNRGQRVRKKKRRNYGGIIAATLAFIILLAAIIMLLFYIEKQAKQPKHEYISLTEEASAKTYVWLSEIENLNISYEDVKEIMGDISLDILLTPTKVKGEYEMSMIEGTYEEAYEKARAGLEKSFKQAVIDRIKSEGFEGNVNDAEVDGLIKEVYGISVSEYVDICEVQVIPAKDVLEAQYSGVVSPEN